MRMLKVNRYMGELYFTWKNPLNLPRDEYVCIKYWHKVLTLFVSQWMHLFGITLSHLISTNQETAFHSLLNSSPDAHRLKKFILFTTLRDPSLVLMPNKEPVIIKKMKKFSFRFTECDIADRLRWLNTFPCSKHLFIAREKTLTTICRLSHWVKYLHKWESLKKRTCSDWSKFFSLRETHLTRKVKHTNSKLSPLLFALLCTAVMCLRLTEQGTDSYNFWSFFPP